MADSDKTTKADSSPKPEAKSSTKTEKSSSSDAPASYSRGEGQKLVTQAYRDNWHAIFGKPDRTAAKTASTKRKPAGKAKKAPAKKTKKKSTR